MNCSFPHIDSVFLLTSCLLLCPDHGCMFVTRRLSQRPTAEELEQRNILKRKCVKLVYYIVLKLLKEIRDKNVLRYSLHQKFVFVAAFCECRLHTV